MAVAAALLAPRFRLRASSGRAAAGGAGGGADAGAGAGAGASLILKCEVYDCQNESQSRMA